MTPAWMLIICFSKYKVHYKSSTGIVFHIQNVLVSDHLHNHLRHHCCLLLLSLRECWTIAVGHYAIELERRWYRLNSFLFHINIFHSIIILPSTKITAKILSITITVEFCNWTDIFWSPFTLYLFIFPRFFRILQPFLIRFPISVSPNSFI